MNNRSTTCFSQRNGKPLMEYSSEMEAQEAADYANAQYRRSMAPYRCSHCGKWHLAPRNRQTPSHPCTVCTDSMGSPKELYESEAAATKRAKIIRKEQGVHLSVYRCPYNDGWHLTKR